MLQIQYIVVVRGVFLRGYVFPKGRGVLFADQMCSRKSAVFHSLFFRMEHLLQVCVATSFYCSQIGHVVCAAYPLATFDTIDPRTGELDSRSALNLIVFGVSKMQTGGHVSSNNK